MIDYQQQAKAYCDDANALNRLLKLSTKENIDLRVEIAMLKRQVETLMIERDGWKDKAQEIGRL